MKEEIKEILEDVKRHLDYVEATKQVSIRDNEMKAMYDCITNLQEEIERLKRDNIIYKLRHNKAIKKLSSAINHYNLENKNNTILFVKEILEGNDISEKSYKNLNGGDDNE